jgi:hypothetical protein
MAVIFGLMLFFLITIGAFRLMYPLTINIYNDLATFYGSEPWAYFIVSIFVIIVFVFFITLLGWLMELYKDLVG